MPSFAQVSYDIEDPKGALICGTTYMTTPKSSPQKDSH